MWVGDLGQVTSLRVESRWLGPRPSTRVLLHFLRLVSAFFSGREKLGVSFWHLSFSLTSFEPVGRRDQVHNGVNCSVVCSVSCTVASSSNWTFAFGLSFALAVVLHRYQRSHKGGRVSLLHFQGSSRSLEHRLYFVSRRSVRC